MPAIPAPQIPETNGLLAVLSVAERERLSPHLERVNMALGDVVYESGFYFPTTFALGVNRRRKLTTQVVRIPGALQLGAIPK